MKLLSSSLLISLSSKPRAYDKSANGALFYAAGSLHCDIYNTASNRTITEGELATRKSVLSWLKEMLVLTLFAEVGVTNIFLIERRESDSDATTIWLLAAIWVALCDDRPITSINVADIGCAICGSLFVEVETFSTADVAFKAHEVRVYLT